MRTLLRFVGYVWAVPNTLIGLVLGALSFQTPRLVRGVLAFDRAPRGFLRIFARKQWRAITFGHVVLSAQLLDGRLLAHELVHVRQYERLGPLFLPAYVTLHLFTGYELNPFETAAVRGESAELA